jgi:DNA-binding response OmpR family regulator
MENKSGKNHILLIDDDEFLLQAMKCKLEEGGYKVTTSSNIQDAYFKLTVLKPDMIILDVIMPDINGIEFMNLITNQLMVVNIPIILMSSLAKKDLYDMGYKFGASQYLCKPFDVNDLPQIMDRAFSRPEKRPNLE